MKMHARLMKIVDRLASPRGEASRLASSTVVKKGVPL